MKEARCVVCCGTSQVVVWRENGYEGRACHCGTVYTSPEPPAGAVDFTHDGHPDSFYSLYAMLKARWLKGCRPRGRLLEIGCGEGYFLAAARSLGYEVAGVEPEPGRAARVTQRLGIDVRCSLLEDLHFPVAKFDIVYHCDLLSHFPDPIEALRKMTGLLARDGILAFEVGILGGIQPFWYRWIESLGYPQHRWFYSERSLRSLLSRAGLRIERTRHFGLAPCVALYRSRVLLGKVVRSLLGPGRNGPSPGDPPATRLAGGNDKVRKELRRHMEDSFTHMEQFFRYRVGAVAPRIGPGTLLVAARPEPDLRPQGSDLRPPDSDLRPQGSDLRPLANWNKLT